MHAAAAVAVGQQQHHNKLDNSSGTSDVQLGISYNRTYMDTFNLQLRVVGGMTASRRR